VRVAGRADGRREAL